jgi:DNA-binding NarL/FixJ family response regulator
MQNSVKILLLSDSLLRRKAVMNLVSNCDGNHAVEEVAFFRSHSELAEIYRYDIVMVDMSNSPKSELSLLKGLLAQKLKTKIVLFTLGTGSNFLTKYLTLGVNCFLHKYCNDVKEMDRAINLALDEKRFISPELMTTILSHTHESHRN